MQYTVIFEGQHQTFVRTMNIDAIKQAIEMGFDLIGIKPL